MRRPPPDHRLHPENTGFVLVGVVMFVLALTILGLSLFSLSSFEAQFLGRAVHEDQAFHSAAGGMERAKFVLAQTADLGAVGAGISESTPLEGIVYASAAQDKDGDGAPDDSTGTVLWAPNRPVTITVRAREREALRTLQATFNPNIVWNPYKFLLASHWAAGGVIVGAQTVEPPNPPKDRRYSIDLDARVWQNDPDTSYTSLLMEPVRGGVRLRDVPEINVPEFMASRTSVAQPPLGGGGSWQLHASGIGYFLTNQAGDFSLRVSGVPGVTISVRDTVVWMFPRGFRFDPMVTVTAAAPGACLIIVANRNGNYCETVGGVTTCYREAAAWFFGGLHSPWPQGDPRHVPIIISTRDQIRLEQFNNYDRTTEIAYLSMYAGSVRLLGPETTNPASPRMLLHHPPVYEDDGLIDRLVTKGALPGHEFLSPSWFRLVAGSWQEVGP